MYCVGDSQIMEPKNLVQMTIPSSAGEIEVEAGYLAQFRWADGTTEYISEGELRNPKDIAYMGINPDDATKIADAIHANYEAYYNAYPDKRPTK